MHSAGRVKVLYLFSDIELDEGDLNHRLGFG